MPGLSIIIPAGDDVSRFEDTLAAVLRNRPRACEVIVPHAGTYADPYELASEVWFIELPPGSTYEQCLAHAAHKAAGEVLHVLSPGCEFEENWWQPALTHFDDASIGSVAPFVSASRAAQPTGAIGVNYGIGGRREVSASDKLDARACRKLKILGPTHHAGFYRRTALKQIGGWPTTLSHTLADVDVALSLSQLGYRAVAEPESRICCPHASRKASAYEMARQREQLYWRHVAGMGLPLALLVHPLVAVTECITAGTPAGMFAALGGKMASLADIQACRAFAVRLQGLKRLTVTDPPPTSSGHPTRREDRRRAA